MKWFQLDSDTPDDPRIRAVLARFGNAGLGALLRLWCFVANHGKRPGQSVDSDGRKIPKPVLVEATGLSEAEFDALLLLLSENGHIVELIWRKKGIVEIPAMRRRVDTYTKRVFEHSSNKVLYSTRQDSTNSTPLPPLKGGRPSRAALQLAKERRARVHGGCPHDPRCSSYAACIALLAQEQEPQVQV
jgi:hypothetical protein